VALVFQIKYFHRCDNFEKKPYLRYGLLLLREAFSVLKFMPRKLLPKPCPKCGVKYGTITFQVFSNNGKLICRIKHYDKEGYKKAIDKIKTKKIDPSKAKSIKTTWQQSWCNFRTEHEFFQEDINRFEIANWNTSVLDSWKCNECKIEEEYNEQTRRRYKQCKEDMHKPEIVRKKGVKSKSFKITDKVRAIIIKEGWKAKLSSSGKYKARQKVKPWEK